MGLDGGGQSEPERCFVAGPERAATAPRFGLEAPPHFARDRGGRDFEDLGQAEELVEACASVSWHHAVLRHDARKTSGKYGRTGADERGRAIVRSPMPADCAGSRELPPRGPPAIDGRTGGTMTHAERVKWWLDNVYRGDMPQLTSRSVLTGFLLGGVLAVTGALHRRRPHLGHCGLRAVPADGEGGSGPGLHPPREQLHAVDRDGGGLHDPPFITRLACSMLVTGVILPCWQMLVWMVVSILGVPGAWVHQAFFGVPWLMSFISLPLIFVLSIICTNSKAFISWTPTGSLSKSTHFTGGAIDRSNPASNIMPAGITGEIPANAATLLSDLKPGYMLGAKPRQQAVGHVIGIFSGALAAILLFYLFFPPPNKEGLRSTATLVSEQFAMPAAPQWKGVADLIAKGVTSLPPSTVVSMIVAAAFEILRIRTKGRFPISAVSVGIGNAVVNVLLN
ncbi:MAG: hypothetical protein C0502_04860 [Opitutus sp.]|nr:hypothetical protein [Opitutus sp.]